MDSIKNVHRETIREILRQKSLGGVLFCGGIRENWDSWLLCSSEIPTLPPFGRMNLFLADASGEIYCLCAGVNHPCDFPHYPIFDCKQFPGVFLNGTIGIVNPECLLKSTRDEMTEYVSDLKFVDLTAEFTAARAEKCPEEGERVRHAAMSIDRAFEEMSDILKEGKTEAQIAVDIRECMKKNGAGVPMLSEDPGAITLVTLTSAPQGGVSIPEPIAFPGRSLCRGDRINICVNGYLQGGFAAALGRCCVLGNASEETMQNWELTVRAQKYAADRLVPGMTVSRVVEQTVEEVLKPAGFNSIGENCIYGIGWSRSEAPRFVDASREMPLKEGMTLVVAPKIQKPGEDAYCCMDVFCVTKYGGRRMSGTGQSLREL